jgi:hypothetical protein
VLLQPLPHLVVAKDIEPPELNALPPQDADRLARETALRVVRVALHEEHDGAAVHERVELLGEGLGGFGRLGGG